MPKDEPIQIYSGAWYAVAHGKPPYTLECCDCGKVHTWEHKIENGAIWERLTVDEKASTAARKRRGITKEVRAIARKEKT